MIIRTKFEGYSRDGVRLYHLGGGGSGASAPTQTTSTSYQTNIPEYARPYVDTMLGATQKQLFEGNPTEDGGFNITGFKPYKPYSTNPDDYVAGFTPMQQQSQQTVANLQVPGQYQAATDITGAGIMGAADVGAQARAFNPMAQQAAGMGRQYQRMATDPNAISAYMSPYMQNVVDTQQREAVRQSDIQRTANMGQATQQGAFGGGRQAIMEAERQRNLGTQLGSIQAQGSQNAFQNAQQAQQYGANLNLQGLQTGAGIYGQGLTAQQQAIQQALGGANQLASLGGQSLEAQKGIAGLQNQYGAQQQALEQQKINQSIQDYSNAQQYPLLQLGTMSNMLRGLPMQAQTTNQYVAAPNQITQGIGAVGAGASLYNAFNTNAPKAAEGGVVKGYAEGGIASVPRFDVGGEVESDLANMTDDALAKEAKESPSPTIRQKAQRILRERQMEQPPQEMASGGIIAFQAGKTVTDTEGDETPLNMSSGPTRPSIKEGVKEVGRGVSKAIARPALPTMLLDSEENAPAVAPAVAPAAVAPAAVAPTGIKTAAAAPRAGTDATQPPVSFAIPKNEITTSNTMARAEPPAPAGVMAAPTSTFASTEDALAEAKKEAKRTVAERAEEIEKLAPENTAVAEYRKQIMDERANAGDEKKRQQYMRAAQFFSTWGSKPGSTLAAGLSALEKTLPDIITDEANFKKAKRELDKVQYDIDNSIRLEKLGFQDKARQEREKAAEKAMNLQHYLIVAQTAERGDLIRQQSAKDTAESNERSHKYTAESNERSHKYTADRNKEGHLAQAAATAGSKAEQNADRIQKQFISSVANRQNEDQNIANERKDPLYVAAKKDLSYKPKNMTPELSKRIEEAKTLVETREAGWKTRQQDAKDLVDMFRQQAVPTLEKRGVKVNSALDAAPAPAATLSPENTEALKWANDPANKNDPRAAAIKKSLSIK